MIAINCYYKYASPPVIMAKVYKCINKDCKYQSWFMNESGKCPDPNCGEYGIPQDKYDEYVEKQRKLRERERIKRKEQIKQKRDQNEQDQGDKNPGDKNPGDQKDQDPGDQDDSPGMIDKKLRF
jgi:hypothetical protein